jgi:hypothetical protein
VVTLETSTIRKVAKFNMETIWNSILVGILFDGFVLLKYENRDYYTIFVLLIFAVLKMAENYIFSSLEGQRVSEMISKNLSKK